MNWIQLLCSLNWVHWIELTELSSINCVQWVIHIWWIEFNELCSMHRGLWVKFWLSLQQYFGNMNSEPVLDLLWSNGRREVMNYVNYTLSSLVRMPYTNNWRVPYLGISHDCSRCTVPAASGQRGIEITNKWVIIYIKQTKCMKSTESV